MRKGFLRFAAAAGVGALAAVGPLAAQFAPATLPPSGGNQRATVIQGIGLVRVSLDYSSPHVHSAAGVDRRGKIWGELVPYGLHNEAFGTCHDKCPWRGGANENTVFTTSHDVKVQGAPLAVGSYGVHFIPDREEWTIIFSKTTGDWGSFFYDAKDDALRVKAKPAKGDYHEDLTYWFRDQHADRATAVLSWEDLDVPFTITAENVNDLHAAAINKELRNTAGFGWQGWDTAAQWALQNKTHLDDGLRWAETAAGPNGQVNFTTLSTLSDLQGANGRTEEAKKTRDRALHDPSAGPIDLHLYGRQLLAQKHAAEALEVFQLNAKLHPDVWPVHVGLGRGYYAAGDRQKALAEFRLAVPQAPDDQNRTSLKGIVKNLEEGKDIAN